MNKALISIGSNEDKEMNITLCRQLLNSAFDTINYSKTSVTEPYGKVYRNNFLNQLAVVYTQKDQSEITILLKEIEKKIGRDPKDKLTGNVKIDIDLVIWNENVLKPEDLKRQYIAQLLESF